MKKTVAILAVCIFASAQASFAETNEAETSSATLNQLKIIPSVGYSYFNITGSDDNYKSKSGGSAAALVQYPLMQSLEIESGLEYLETGAKQTLDFGIFSLDTATLEMQQLTIPLRAKYTFNPQSENTQYYGKAGITPTYLMSAKMDSFTGSSADVKSTLNEWGLLTQAALGADWKLETVSGRVSFDLIYSYGLTKVFKDNSNGRLTGFQAQLGYVVSL